MNIKFICIISGILLLLAIPNGWPYDFYILLRWIISIASAVVAYQFYKSKLFAWTWIFGTTAIVFNPIMPIYMNKSNWVSIDFVVAVLFFFAAYSDKKSKHK